MGGAIYNANLGMGEPTYGLLLSLIASCIEGSSLGARSCSAATLSRYVLCYGDGIPGV